MRPSVLLRALAALVLIGLGGVPAWAAGSVSPAQVLPDIDVTLTLRFSSDALDLTTSVSASVPDGVQALACGAPDGWSCELGATSASWRRETSLVADDTFTLAIHTPAEVGPLLFLLSESRTSGATESSSATVEVVAPEPTETPSPTPTPTPTPTPEPPAPDDSATLAPFRPPNGDEEPPISIRDLPSDADNDAGTTEPDADRVVRSGGPAPTSLLAGLVVLLLCTSAGGFTLARMNR